MESENKSPRSTRGHTTEPAQAGDIVEQLVDWVGIEKGYLAADGTPKTISEATRRRILALMGFETDSPDKAERSLRRVEERGSRLSAVLVLKQGDPIDLVIPVSDERGADRCRWRLDLEDGTSLTGDTIAGRADIDDRSLMRAVHAGRVPLGYHWLSLHGLAGKCQIIVVPERAYQPSRWQQGDRDWILTVQLYSLRSRENWGIGDFRDLRKLIEKAVAQGASGIGLNPLHALFPSEPGRASPYSPSSRCFFNPIYLDVTAIPEFEGSENAQRRIGMPGFQACLDDARRQDLVDYDEVWGLKSAVLRDLHDDFRRRHFSVDGQPLTQRAEDFVAFCHRGGDHLREFAGHQALQEALHRAGEGLDWHGRPQDLAHIKTAIEGFSRDHAEQVSFFQYLQFETDRQLSDAQAFAKDAGMAIGLYLDIAVGSDPAGADGWTNQALYVQGCNIGAPPDLDNPLGQDWGLVPPNPLVLRDQAYRSFIAAVRAGMAHAGAIRIDHILGLKRLWWVPHGKPASEGAYINYPLDDLLGILALESHRHRCIVIGEDLGTVPPGFREELARRGMLSYRLLQFEREPDTGRFVSPQRYPELAVASFTTHDLPTIQGLVTATDLAWRRDLALFPSEEVAEQAARARSTMLDQLRDALGLSEAAMADPEQLAAAVHAYLAATPTRLVLVQIEDLLGLREQMNLPGTVDEHPNWRRRLTMRVNDLLDGPLAHAVIERLRDQMTMSDRGA